MSATYAHVTTQRNNKLAPMTRVGGEPLRLDKVESFLIEQLMGTSSLEYLLDSDTSED